MAGIDAYRSALRSAVRGYWSGVLDLNQFFDAARTTMNRRLEQAFDEGAAQFGVTPDEYTPEEFLAVGNAIVREMDHLPSLAERINQNSKANGGKLTPLLNRVDIWVKRYTDIKNQAAVLVSKNKKLIWRLGATEEHCRTCNKLNGKVKRGSTWKESGIRPQNPPNAKIQCGGWNCKCELLPTTQPISKGPLPR